MPTRLEVKVEGLHEAIGDLRQIPQLIRAALYAGIAQATEYVAERTREFIDNEGDGMWPPHSPLTEARHGPHKLLNLTGRLRNNIDSRSSGLVGSVRIGTPYAAYHEMGTKSMPARPIFTYVAERTYPEVIRIVEAALSNFLGTISDSAERLFLGTASGGASSGLHAAGMFSYKHTSKITGNILNMPGSFNIAHGKFNVPVLFHTTTKWPVRATRSGWSPRIIHTEHGGWALPKSSEW